ncbi:uncharacterized protein DAT39_023324%2C partial, partial [Scomber scombrus]
YKPAFRFLPGSPTQLKLQASAEAVQVARQNRQVASQPLPLMSMQRAESDAWARVTAQGGNPTDRRNILSRMEVQFGQYRGQTFHWLLTHDVGYSAGLLASHKMERGGGNKDVLLEYACLFPSMAAAIEDKLRAGTDAEGDCTVWFGAYSSMTFRELYESTGKDVSSNRSWVRIGAVNNPGSRLAKLKLYVARRDRSVGVKVLKGLKQLITQMWERTVECWEMFLVNDANL